MLHLISRSFGWHQEPLATLGLDYWCFSWLRDRHSHGTYILRSLTHLDLVSPGWPQLWAVTWLVVSTLLLYSLSIRTNRSLSWYSAGPGWQRLGLGCPGHQYYAQALRIKVRSSWLSRPIAPVAVLGIIAISHRESHAHLNLILYSAMQFNYDRLLHPSIATALTTHHAH